MGATPNNGSGDAPTTSSIKSVDEIIQNVKPDDIHILSNIPSYFLNKEQLAGKRKGLYYVN